MKQVLVRLAMVVVATIASAVGLLGVGRLIVFGDITLAQRAQPPSGIATIAASPTEERAISSSVRTADPSPIATASPTASPPPSPTVAPLALTSFRSGRRGYVGIVVPEPTFTFVAPFAGRVEVRVYQLIDGEVRVGSNIPSLPFFPYVTVVSADQRIVYRPGTLGAVTELIATDGAAVLTGEPLFRLVAAGRSSWTTFYDARAPYQVVVSLQSVPSGRDLDPAIYFR